jgi:hypothetical protein
LVLLLALVCTGPRFRTRAFSLADLPPRSGCVARAHLTPGAIVSKDVSSMRFQSDPNLKPTEIQPLTTQRRTPVRKITSDWALAKHSRRAG